MMSLLLLNNFYTAMSSSTSSKEEESDELLCAIRSLVMVREPVCQRSGLITRKSNVSVLAAQSIFLERQTHRYYKRKSRRRSRLESLVFIDRKQNVIVEQTRCSFI